MIGHEEAQELHLLVGAPLELARQNGAFDPEYVTVKASDLERARELAAVIVADTMPDPADNVSYFPCIEGVIDDGENKSSFMIPLDTNSSTKYINWGADNTVLWPRTDLLEAMSDAAREWAYENLPQDNDEEDSNE